MQTINETLNPPRTALTRLSMWLQAKMTELERTRLTIEPRRTVNVQYEPVEFTTVNGRKWHCQHAHPILDYVSVGSDESELLPICETCDAQLINGEWHEAN